MLRGINVVDYEIKISKRFVDVVYSITELTFSRRRPLIYGTYINGLVPIIYQWTGFYMIGTYLLHENFKKECICSMC